MDCGVASLLSVSALGELLTKVAASFANLTAALARATASAAAAAITASSLVISVSVARFDLKVSYTYKQRQ